MPSVSTTAIHCHALTMAAGRPANRGFSTSSSCAAANAARSVLQNRHLIATALMVSPHTGHALVSSLMLLLRLNGGPGIIDSLHYAPARRRREHYRFPGAIACSRSGASCPSGAAGIGGGHCRLLRLAT